MWALALDARNINSRGSFRNRLCPPYSDNLCAFPPNYKEQEYPYPTTRTVGVYLAPSTENMRASALGADNINSRGSFRN